jgi:hypothetical protein
METQWFDVCESSDASRTFFLVAPLADSGSKCKVGEIAGGRRSPCVEAGRHRFPSIFHFLSRERASPQHALFVAGNNADCSTLLVFRRPRHNTLDTVLSCDMCLCLQRARLNAVHRATCRCQLPQKREQSSRLTRTPSEYIQALRHSSETAAR